MAAPIGIHPRLAVSPNRAGACAQVDSAPSQSDGITLPSSRSQCGVAGGQVAWCGLEERGGRLFRLLSHMIAGGIALILPHDFKWLQRLSLSMSFFWRQRRAL